MKMRTISEFPRLQYALEFLGMDNGANVDAKAVVPAAWEMRARMADDELLLFSAEEIETFTGGEESEIEALAKRAPAATEFLNAAFDGGELSELLMKPWTNIFDARSAEARIAKKEKKQ